MCKQQNGCECTACRSVYLEDLEHKRKRKEWKNPFVKRKSFQIPKVIAAKLEEASSSYDFTQGDIISRGIQLAYIELRTAGNDEYSKATVPNRYSAIEEMRWGVKRND